MGQLQQQLQTLPSTPGVYLFKDAAGQVLYVGKAKVLRHRVRSYFRAGAVLDGAKRQMVPQIASMDTISCDSENEALVLEANLIGKLRPPYNVVLTDDKYYLFIKITKEAWPRVFPVRRLTHDGARYFGPYSSASAVRATLKLLRRIFPFRGEKESPREVIFPHPLFTTRASLTPAGKTPDVWDPLTSGVKEAGVFPAQAAYQQNIVHIIRFLKGERQEIMARLKEGMQTAAAAQQFERAGLFRDQFRALERLEGWQKVYLSRPESFDVVSVASAGGHSAANVFAVRRGKLLEKNTFLLRHRRGASGADVLRQFLLQYYGVAQDVPGEILVPERLPDGTALMAWINGDSPPALLVPRRGVRRQLVLMGEANARQLLTQAEAARASSQRLQHASEQLATALGLPGPLKRIETYDISNIQGTLATGSMVVFMDGQPSKQHYKKFRIRLGDNSPGAARPNDYAMIQEVLRRRFARRHDPAAGQEMREQWPRPDLIVIDGGKGQLSAAQKVLDAYGLQVPVIALAKREEEVFRVGQREALRLPYDAEALYLLQRMRDEAHRFTLTYHQLLRRKRQQRSLLDEIPGIGPKLKKKLLARFGSLAGIRATSAEQLADVVGAAKARVMRDYL